MATLKTAPTLRASVVIIGAGIAGTWLGLKLARAGVDTMIIHYGSTDRGGLPGSSARSVGAINTSPLKRTDFRHLMDELGQGQHHPSVVDLLLNYLPEELPELLALGEFKDIKLGVAVASGNAGPLLGRLHKLFESYGGRMLHAWVTRIVADETTCRGVQYQQGDTIGKVLAPALVIASGGYAGLFDGSVKTNNYGMVLGRFLQVGGVATNLEFIFKHGYGKPDMGALTPTEELPGAEIYDSDGNHAVWLERELFEGRGTANHLEAFKYWRRNSDKDFFIDLKFRPVTSKLLAFNAALAGLGNAKGTEAVTAVLSELIEMCPMEGRAALQEKLVRWSEAGQRVDFDRFCEIKEYFHAMPKGEVFRVRQIAYFSMGGIAHVDCATNLANVFVTGEAMHDFGAHRVGGLPWALYLSTGRIISEQLIDLVGVNSRADGEDFELINRTAHFDGAVLEDIRARLYRHQEHNFNVADASSFVEWLRGRRRELLERGDVLDDAVAWLIVAEGIMQASLRRMESRGCFYRPDYPTAAEHMKARFTFTHYDTDADVVDAELIRIPELPRVVLRDRLKDEYRAAAG